LRVLQEREAERVGGLRPYKVNARIIAATNQEIEQAVKEERFRADLFYRLNVLPISIPPLRERQEDIPEFISAALSKVTGQLRCKPKWIRPEVVEALVEYPWYGNVRELYNVVERMANLTDGDEIGVKDLPSGILNKKRHYSGGKLKPLNNVLEEAEKAAIIQAVQETKGNISAAAKILGIHRVTLHEKLKRHSLSNGSNTTTV
jgi:transcriptional regulator with PAS, ATPase and Fis domain